MENDKILQKMFDLCNSKYFKNELPQIKLEWNNRKTSAGLFHRKWQRVEIKEGDVYTQNIKEWKGGYFKSVPEKISISYPYFIDRKNNGRLQEMIETMVEEMVHYWQCVTGNGNGHDNFYYQKMEDVGCPVDSKTRFCEKLESGMNWKYSCTNSLCDMEYLCVRRLKNEKNRTCAKCHNKLKIEYIGR